MIIRTRQVLFSILSSNFYIRASTGEIIVSKEYPKVDQEPSCSLRASLCKQRLGGHIVDPGRNSSKIINSGISEIEKLDTEKKTVKIPEIEKFNQYFT